MNIKATKFLDRFTFAFSHSLVIIISFLFSCEYLINLLLFRNDQISEKVSKI